jgi:hypothetical protein
MSSFPWRIYGSEGLVCTEKYVSLFVSSYANNVCNIYFMYTK